MEEGTRIPVVRLKDNLIVSVQVALSDDLVNHLKDDITKAIARTRARGLVIDVSGVDLMDSYISRTIRDIGSIARIMGTQAVICGLKPMIAMTLVQMGVAIQDVYFELDLDTAIDRLELERWLRAGGRP